MSIELLALRARIADSVFSLFLQWYGTQSNVIQFRINPSEKATFCLQRFRLIVARSSRQNDVFSYNRSKDLEGIWVLNCAIDI